MKNGGLVKLETGVFKSINGYVYTTDKTKRFDENGEMIPNSFENCDLYLSKFNLITKDGNIEYYYVNRYEIYKVEWINDIEYTYEKRVIDERFTEPVVISKKIYFVKDGGLFSIDIISGVKEKLGSEKYYFSSIQSDNLGNAQFVALDTTNMQKVEGMIKNDGTIETNVIPNKYIVYYIKPLN